LVERHVVLLYPAASAAGTPTSALTRDLANVIAKISHRHKMGLFNADSSGITQADAFEVNF
jgi:hypothetical protein